MGYSQIVIDCTVEKTLTVLRQAQQLGMTGSYHSYLLTSLVIIACIAASYRRRCNVSMANNVAILIRRTYIR